MGLALSSLTADILCLAISYPPVNATLDTRYPFIQRNSSATCVIVLSSGVAPMALCNVSIVGLVTLCCDYLLV